MIEILIMACILGMAFGMGMYMGIRIERERRRRRRADYYVYGNLRPSANPDPEFDEEYWKHNPPPFKIGGSMAGREGTR